MKDIGFNKLENKKNSTPFKIIEVGSTASTQGKTRTKLTTDSYSRKRLHDDDDFVNIPPVFVPVERIAKKQTTIANIEKLEDSLRSLNTRFPPEHITKTMALLNQKQRECVESIGFGSALTMRLERLPRMLCYWLVDNYDPNTNSLRVRDERPAVTRKIVHEIYQIPMGNIPMSNPSKANPENNVVRIWKSQFPNSIKRIRLTHVIDMICNDTEAGPLFILNFLVMFVSVMIGFPSMGTVNQGFLENISDDVDITHLDWCGFIISCLNSSRMMWKRLDDKCVYTGPIGFLLLFYLRFTKVGDATKEIPKTGLIHWTTGLLKQRETEELAKGGFGNVVISSQFMDMHQSEQENGDQDDVFQSERHHADGVTKDIANERPQHNEENNLEGIIMEINNNFSGYYNAMKSIDEWLGQGVKNYPDSEELRMLVNKRNQEFNLSWPDFSNGNSSHDKTFCDAAMTPVTHGHANTTKNYRRSVCIG